MAHLEQPHKVKRWESKDIQITKIITVGMSWVLSATCKLTGQVFKKRYLSTPKKKAISDFNSYFQYLVR